MNGPEIDELYPAAIGALRATRCASTSTLQRRLRIGYNRAMRLMGMLQKNGVVGPENGAAPREILVDLNTDEGFCLALNAPALATASDPDGDAEDCVRHQRRIPSTLVAGMRHAAVSMPSITTTPLIAAAPPQPWTFIEARTLLHVESSLDASNPGVPVCSIPRNKVDLAELITEIGSITEVEWQAIYDALAFAARHPGGVADAHAHNQAVDRVCRILGKPHGSAPA